jgi:hypothetical protein
MENNNGLEWEEIEDNLTFRSINTNHLTIQGNNIEIPADLSEQLKETASLFYCESINKFKLTNDSKGKILIKNKSKKYRGKIIHSKALVDIFKLKLGDMKYIPCVIENDCLIIG